MATDRPLTDEKDLLLKLRDGNEAAFSELYDRYAKRIAAKLLRLLKSRELAQDILQDVFIKLWDVRQSVDPEHSFPAYLYRIAVNLSANAYRKSLREAYMRSRIDSAKAGYNHVEESVFGKEDASILHEALSKLPERQREVFILHKLEGKSYKEISELLAITPSAVNQHIQRATKTLRNILVPETGAILLFLSFSLSGI